MTPVPRRSKWKTFLLWGGPGLVFLICGVLFTGFWARFYPSGRTPISGPTGFTYRAFIEDRSFNDISLIACAADWPYTFRKPFALGDLYFPQAYTSAKLFWSKDGSVLVFRVIHHDENTEVSETAYDFQEHVSMEYNHEAIDRLIQSRGGLGPQFNAYSESKGDG